MPRNDDTTPDNPRGEGSSDDGRLQALGDSAKRFALIAVGLVVVALIAAAVIPRWWSQRLGNVVDGSLTTGSLTGFLLGVVCTALPLFILARALSAGLRGWKLVWSIVGAIVIAFPNLATLWIHVGGGSGAHAGRRVLDVDAPGVRGGTLVGTVVGVIGMIALELALRSRRAAKRELSRRSADDEASGSATSDD